MNTPKTAALAAATLMLVATVIPAAHAAPAEPAAAGPRVVLRYSMADAATEKGARDLYRRISRAAAEVCPEGSATGLVRNALAAQCRQDAVNRAVGQVHEQRLVEVAAAHTRRG